MDIDELRTVRRTEREKDSLQHLRDSFYEDVAVFLSDLKAQRDRAADRAEDPFASDDVRRLTDQIETATEVSEAIYERRVGKVVKLASFAAADMSVETDGMTHQEHQLFEDLVGRIKQNKSTVLDILAGEHDPAAAAEAAASSTETPAAETTATPASADTETASPAPDPAAETDSSPGTPEAAAESGSGMLADAMGGASSGPDAPSSETASAAEATPTDPDAPAVEASRAPADTESTPEASPEVAPEESPVAATPSGPADESGDEGAHTPVDPEAATPGAPEREGAEPNTDGGTVTPSPDTERTTVRITRDVGHILGTDDREYDLASEDVVTLPATNAEPLLQKDAAEKLE